MKSESRPTQPKVFTARPKPTRYHRGPREAVPPQPGGPKEG